VSHDQLLTAAKPGDAILCRFNAPIVTLAYTFLSEGVAAKIEGRDIGTNLKTICKRWRVKTVDAFMNKLDEYRDRQTAKLRLQQRESLAAAVEDKVKCIEVLLNRIVNTQPDVTDIVSALCSEIDRLFGDNIAGSYVLLSSIHKSKGREWRRVFWLQTGAPKWIRKDWERGQEVNLNYVAATRSQSELYLVSAAVNS
jgi:superfamily I DNA/RNA helicase